MAKMLRYTLIGLSLLATLTGVFFLQRIYWAQERQALPDIAAVPNFSLTDQQAALVTPWDLRGKIWVADFIFTSCQGQCPQLSAAMRQLSRKYAPSSSLRLISISVDPENDTPAVLAAYARRYEADARQWHFLTGTKAAIRELMVQGFKIGSDDDPNLHSTFMILIDGQGRIRGYYDGLDRKALRRLRRDLKFLLKSSTA